MLRERAARQARKRRTKYLGPHRPHPRRQHLHETPKSWKPVFPYPMRSTWALVEQYALYFGT